MKHVIWIFLVAVLACHSSDDDVKQNLIEVTFTATQVSGTPIKHTVLITNIEIQDANGQETMEGADPPVVNGFVTKTLHLEEGIPVEIYVAPNGLREGLSEAEQDVVEKAMRELTFEYTVKENGIEVLRKSMKGYFDQIDYTVGQ